MIRVVLLILILIPSVSAFSVSTVSFEADSYHTGLGASKGSTATYDQRNTGTIQGSNDQTITGSFIANSGWLLADRDGDGFPDTVDTLEGRIEDVFRSGVSNLTILIDGGGPIGTYSGPQNVRFFDGSSLLVNFTHNFSLSDFDLGLVTIIVNSSGIVVNLSGQLQPGETKSLTLTDNGFTSLCVEDAEIASLDDISSDCSGMNETDFTSCLGGSATINGIACVDNGATITVSNMSFSGVSGGTGAVSSATTSGGSGGGGSSAACSDQRDNDGDGLKDYPNDPGCENRWDMDETDPIEPETCKERWVCTDWFGCANGVRERNCEEVNQCGTEVYKPIMKRTCGSNVEVETPIDEGVEEPIPDPPVIINEPLPVKQCNFLNIERSFYNVCWQWWVLFALLMLIALAEFIYYEFEQGKHKVKVHTHKLSLVHDLNDEFFEE